MIRQGLLLLTALGLGGATLGMGGFLVEDGASGCEPEPPALSETVVAYADSPGAQRFHDTLQLSDGSFLMVGAATDLDFVPEGTPLISLGDEGFNPSNSPNTGQMGIILHVSGDLSEVKSCLYFPEGIMEEVSRVGTTSAPGATTGDIYISGRTRVNRSTEGGYFIARLNDNFIKGIPTSLDYVYDVWAEGDHQTRQPWDVGSDGSVLYVRGQAWDYDWAALHRIDRNGELMVVENWRTHWSLRADGSTTELRCAPATACAIDAQVTPLYSGVILKTTGRCELRSWTEEAYSAIEDDGNGGTRQGAWPMDYFFSGPCDPSSPTTSGPGYTGYNMGTHPTLRVGDVTIDRLSGDAFLGVSVQSRLPGGNPDFEPVVIAFGADGSLKWWSRLYEETEANSSPDQYVDHLALDYARGTLVVGARAHGNNVVNLWEGNTIARDPDAFSFHNQFTGTEGNIHISWLGKLALGDGELQASTYVAEYPNGMAGTGAPYTEPIHDGWPNHNAGWPDLNTTRLYDLEVDDEGRVHILAMGRRTMTTSNAYQKMYKLDEGESAWNHFARVYEPDLRALAYSSILRGPWDPAGDTSGRNVTLRALVPTETGTLVVGEHIAEEGGMAKGVPVPTAAVPAWAKDTPEGAAALFAHFAIVAPEGE